MEKPPEWSTVNLSAAKGINYKGHAEIQRRVIKSYGLGCRKARTVLLKGMVLLHGDT
jgi:hypothetical protein